MSRTKQLQTARNFQIARFIAEQTRFISLFTVPELPPLEGQEALLAVPDNTVKPPY